jgi:hypothetical protein
MKALPIALTLALAAGITGCSGSSTGSLPASPPPHSTSSASRQHLSTATKVVPVKKSIQQQRRMPKDTVGGPPNMFLLLLDAPLVDGQNAQVNIGLVGINALSNGVVTPIVTYSSPQVVNLLTLENTAQQYAASLPAGSYDTLQLVVDPSTSNVVYWHGTYPMQFGALPSDPGDYAGINAPATFTTSASGSVTVTADFNVFESVDLENGVALVNPQVVTAIDATDVSGTVLNVAGTPVTDAVVLALDGNGNVLNSTITASDGTFTIQALAPGTVSLVVQNSYTSASGEIVNASGADASPPGPVPLTLTGGTLNAGTLTD